MTTLLPSREPQGFQTPASSMDAQTLDSARGIVDTVRQGGDEALRQYIDSFEQRTGDPLLLDREALEAACARIPETRLALLQRTADRIRRFADAQRSCITPLEMPIPGGLAGHSLAPVEKAACYAPGGRFPLPSSVLMTAVTARSAGVAEVWVVTPSSEDVMLAAAAVAGADGVIWAGGAQAIAAVAFGTESVPQVDIIVGPGNRWVTAAKQLVSGQVGIDMLAGPSELVVLADETADPAWVAADLIAQAEHDPDAVPILVTTSEPLIVQVREELETQLEALDTAPIAAESLRGGAALWCESLEQGIEVVNAIGPEHLEVQLQAIDEVVPRLKSYGGLFIGSGSAEVLGDYGAGPNHVLPTSGTSRYTGGLSVFDFLRVRTWMKLDTSQRAQELFEDAEALARVEGLSGHAASARIRSSKP